MKTPDEQLLGRWLDGELSADERTRFEVMLATDASLREEADSLKQLSGLIRANVTLERPVPNGDFFNSQLQERIEAEKKAMEREKPEARPAGSWLNWLRAPWALAGAAAVLAVGLLVLRPAQVHTQILSLYAPNPSIHASSYHSNAAEATVLMLSGLDAIPSDRNVTGFNVHHSKTDMEVATTTLFDDQGEILLVMSKDAASKPVVFSRKG